MADMARWARFYAKRGFPVLPLYPVDEQGCACRRPICGSPGKHPLTDLVPNGLTSATIDRAAIDQWWGLWPDANIGLAMGEAAGTMVVDIDDWASWDRLLGMHGPAMASWISYTPSGGAHAWFVYPSEGAKTTHGTVAAGIDIKAQGGYVVAPPSVGMQGPYEWDDENRPSPNGPPLTDAPDWLLRLVWSKREESQPRQGYRLPTVIVEGGRNSELIRIGGAVRRHGATPDEVEALLQKMNRDRCKPPLPEGEVRQIAWSTHRWEPAQAPRARVR